MEDNFDSKRYVEAYNQFMFDMIYVVTEKDPNIPRYTAPVASLLRIGRIEAVIYENPDCENRDEGETYLIHNSPDYDPDRSTYNREILGNGNIVHYRFYQTLGEPVWNSAECVRISAFERTLAVFQERFKMKGVVEYFMNYDIMLQVHNLWYLLNKMGELAGRRILSKYGLCQMNLRQFSIVNEYLGRENGTKLMLKYTKAIMSIFDDEHETFSRVGGDNFAVLFRKEKIDTLTKLLEGVPLQPDNGNMKTVTVSASAGIYMIPDASLLPSDVMDRASIAAKTAKNNRSHIVFFDDQMQYASDNAKRVQALFPRALSGEEFRVYYQPKVYLRDYSLAGAEALCRWVHDSEFITPDKFIPVFEQKGLIAELDFYMLEHVCKDMRRWLDGGKRVVPVSVNISRCHFEDKQLFEHIMEIIDRYSIPHEFIEIELTETTTDVDFSFLKDIITRLRAAGVTVSVDDFGTGYSSLNLIRELPWDIIKLDKSLLNNDENDIHGKMMLSHIIYMAKELGIRCICEGVETTEHIRILKESNCLLAQGFYFDRPLPIEDFEERLSRKGRV